jgi:hypothetical protein
MRALQSILHRLGLFLCALGWHRRPYAREPKPPGLTVEEYVFHPLYRCLRCGLVGRLDGHGNLAPQELPEHLRAADLGPALADPRPRRRAWNVR